MNGPKVNLRKADALFKSLYSVVTCCNNTHNDITLTLKDVKYYYIYVVFSLVIEASGV